ncbi:MAG: hypothetical protein L3J20_07235 [Flavobacteriaceae bacterium]|nr:hypothetical protein [Flavobacteriaceae bacterium]
MKKRKYITLIITVFLTIQFSSCDFKVKGENGNTTKFSIEKDNLLSDDKLDKLLKDYTDALDAIGIDDIEDGQMTEEQKQKIIKGSIKTRGIAAQITKYVENYSANLKKIPKNCSAEIKKLKEVNAKLDTVIEFFSTYNTQEPTMEDPLKLLGISMNFSGYIMHVYNARITCSVSIDTIE